VTTDAEPTIEADDGGPAVRPPSVLLLMLESLSIWEYATLPCTSPLLAVTPFGDGHPVLVLPGFGGSDHSTAPMRVLLRLKGYDTHGWTLGSNIGPHPRIVRAIARKLLDLHERTGRRVSIIGWSLGGVLARELGRTHPEAVRQVITMASPFRFRPGDRGYASMLYDAIGPKDMPFDNWTLPEQHRIELSMPSTSIYSRTDGIVRWHTCIDEQGALRENIGVRATHLGLGSNIAALIAIADRLAQPEGQWYPFSPPLPLRLWYRRPTWWQPATQTTEEA
jgi:pimeloyl-ACP methyl ester carboxylesterase